ncbi:MAG: type IX secretion system membrane protein PorP/SprF [Allomuricauda sp.]|nr:MAG: type IX secretion system membrane protein PorP/SprF [Allomuricauda sp.]
MKRLFCVFLFLFLIDGLRSQNVVLPEDLRQHNLTQFNANLLNPTFSIDVNRPNAISLWSRWQWQTIDGDPTSIFLSYTGNINEVSAFNVGFLQHNTGTFLNTGGVLNYARSIISENNLRLIFAVNLIGFQQELADDRFVMDADLDLPQLQDGNQFLLRLNPGVRLEINDFDLALSLENGINLISAESVASDSGKNFVGIISNDFPLTLFSGLEDAFLRPALYVKTLANADTQFGLNTLLSTSKFWLQGGYNNFYGPSVGLGGTFAKSFSIGGLLEFPTDATLRDESSTFELVLSYHFDSVGKKKETIGFENEQVDDAIELKETVDNPTQQEQSENRSKLLEEQQREKDSLDNVAKALRNAKVRDSLNQTRIAMEQKRVQDSISQAQRREEAKLESQRRNDSIVAEQQRIEKQRQERQQRIAKQQREKDSLEQVAQERRNSAIRDSINEVRMAAKAKRVRDSIAQVQQAQEEALMTEQKRKDSIAALQEEDVEVQPNEKYEEVRTADGLEPGFYLIANVFGTKKYFESFMKSLQDKGLQPKSFFRKLNGYNYVYLERYNTIDEARRARDTNFGGKYPDKTWIFRVRGE